jgi:hypothetical protein
MLRLVELSQLRSFAILSTHGKSFISFNLQEHVKRTIKKADRMLIIGCGNSEISADLFDNKYTNITNLDFSPLVIEEMIEKNRYRYVTCLT